jgi:hypothetical protein
MAAKVGVSLNKTIERKLEILRGTKLQANVGPFPVHVLPVPIPMEEA